MDEEETDALLRRISELERRVQRLEERERARCSHPQFVRESEEEEWRCSSCGKTLSEIQRR
jgi:ribosomal protein L37AE/L43A